ncbi:MAG: response regulator transcription factor [Actinobacteria bacterium]|nr:response regulator transcription factor [Actinomycetota bacterium]MCG2818318.1 response regulator transcription factor [Actinomycetes bacterium]MBU4218442.1 response regulator transcription factor [Actinomycetota bacterium]MBU4358824.1 response regulator transcription factor [Actinomycetota bacterium]MBU4393117.1 response regulator transcription factor [Actinomycetota bacterium]
MNEKILVVDDEKKIVKMVKNTLENEGYVVLEASDGEAALELFREERPDLVVLDILMPRMDGFEFCRRVRETSRTPIVILSAKLEEDDKLEGLGLGADDYMTKPFSPRELVARIRAVLRRHKAATDPRENRIVRGPLTIWPDEHRLEINGEYVAMTPTEFGILLALARNPGRVFSRRELMEAAQVGYFEGYESTVDAHVGNIRRKVSDRESGWSLIETVYGVGYRLGVEEKD